MGPAVAASATRLAGRAAFGVFPAVADQGRVYFVSDDGYLYCLDGSSGDLL